MAVINGLYIHVTDESLTRDVDATSHPVESGIPLTDTVRSQATAISLSGKIVDYGTTKAAEVISKLKKWQASGDLLEYRGRNVASSMQIRSLETSHPNTIHGGADFSMELVQVRIAKSSYVPKQESTQKQEEAAKKEPEITPEKVKRGMTVVFTGGPVYYSSTAKKPSATRGRSTCLVTYIKIREWALHQYHLQSKDGGKVYGWVDLENIEGATATSKSGTSNAGTQQVSNGSGTDVWHKVKKGDTVYNLVNKKYSDLGKSVQWVIDMNPNAFSKKGDATTLIVGAKLLMGYR